MAFKKGHKRFGGRKKGYIPKDRQMFLDKAAELGIDPTTVTLLYAGRDYKALKLPKEIVIGFDKQTGKAIKQLSISPELQQKSAKDCLVYILPQLKAVEVTGKDGSEIFKSLTDIILASVSKDDDDSDDDTPEES